jgi:hypothetical protein
VRNVEKGKGDVEERYPRDEKKETKKSHSARDCVSAAESPSRVLVEGFAFWSSAGVG